ncbi:MAG: cysteinyl-tRNA synthetase [Thermoplasmata archaeon]|jgi:cysteinyl-tRNA synthetase|nr:cysteinyl-tRNA synthetase [Thermoplasmata archaeon]
MRVHNTKTNSLQELVPQEPGHVRMYVCGPSVYDESHLGHARSYVAYDAIKRVLRAKGLRVTHVQNFTDVEEHVAERAARAGMAPLAYASMIIEHFFRDMDALRILRADHYPRVSEHIPDIVRIVEGLKEKRVAYRFDCGPRPHVIGDGCDIYFDVTRFPDYGALVGANVEELTVERPEKMGDRRNPLDFALWKSRDDWGVTWDSPWGIGRPGWHVECAAMSTKYLGFGFDIHGGGLDLVFPHHENERAIGEAYAGTTYCQYYLHNGFVTVGNEKMSKSLGNFVTVREMLERHDAEVVRAFLLSAHYRAPLNYDEKSIQAAEARVGRWRDAIAHVRYEAHGHRPAAALAAPVCTERDAFWAALDDDFHFGRALDAIDRALEAALTMRGDQAAAALACLREMGQTLGVLWDA